MRRHATTQVRPRRRSHPKALAAALVGALAAGIAAVAVPPQVQAAAYDDLLTDNVVQINETVSDAGFVHPGVGLSAADLRNAQEMVRSGQEPWSSYFDAMTQVRPWASPGYTVDNMVRGKPDTVVTADFDQGGLRGRLTRDSFGVLTQALLWTMTGDEVYRKGAIMGLRTWSNMNPDGYEYFPDAHIHTGKPLSQFLMAAEIVRATEPLDDDSPGVHEGYGTVWTAEDDEKLLANLADPIVDTFLFSNEKWMNQHNFGLYGRIATAIYADDAEGYAEGVEWFTMNSTYDGYDNGALGVQIQDIAADDPLNPYGHEFTQVREMGRDQAHGETNIDNFAALARFLDVQGTKVDSADGTVSTADDAVTAYRFLDDRLLKGANAFYGFMMGVHTPYVDERQAGGPISQAYRGRVFNAMSELYLQYTYREGVDVEAEAPHLAELHSRMDGPFYRYGTGTANFWSPGDKSPEYWVAFPPELAGTAPRTVEDTAMSFGRYALPLDDGTEIVSEGDRAFARAHAGEAGTTTAVSRLMYPRDTAMGVLVRTDGPATLEVLNNNEPSGLNPDEPEPGVIGTVELPDTGGEWRYVIYPARGSNTHFYRVTGAEGTTVDFDTILFRADEALTAPRFEQDTDRYYLWPNADSSFDLSAVDEGGSVAYTARGLPDGAVFEAGTLDWRPSPRDRGRYDVQIVADDGETVTAKTFEFTVAKNRPKMIYAAIADGVDRNAVYTTETREPYEAALAAVQRVADEDGTDAEFREAFEALLDAIDALRLLNPPLADGTLDFRGIVTATGINAGGVDNLADDNADSHGGDMLGSAFTLDFGAGYRIATEAFDLRARYNFPNRYQGANVYGSVDGANWTLLTERETTETEAWEPIPVIDEHVGEEFRFLKVQVDTRGEKTDPAYPDIFSVGELRLHGRRSEAVNTITESSLSSEDAVNGMVTAGDTVTATFTSAEPVTDVAVTIAGQSAAVASEDGRNWTATTELGEVTGGRMIPVAVDYTTADNRTADTYHYGSVHGTRLFASDERHFIDLHDTGEVVDADGDPAPGLSGQSQSMTDGDLATASDVRNIDGRYQLIWDFGEGSSFTLDRAALRPRQDGYGTSRMWTQRLEGSNDLEHWTPLTDQTEPTLDWQDLPALDDGEYRYLRVRNDNIIGIAELRLYGGFTFDLDAIVARAEAVDPTPHSRASGILFARELEAVKAAAAEEGADEQSLAQRLLDAWDLLEPAATEVAASLEQSWVIASSGSWDGTKDAAANGWAMFDGDTATVTDTTVKSGWVTVIPTDDTVFTMESIRYHPRSGAVSRANNMSLQGSNDGGATWTTFASTGIAAAGWNTVDLAEPVQYGALRVTAGDGYMNLAELQFIAPAIDKTGLDLYLAESGELTESDWTADSWAALTAARDAARALADDEGATQQAVDEATADLAAAIEGLTRP